MNTPQSWYSIRQRTPVAAAAIGVQSAAEIFIYGDIGESWYGDTVTAAQFVKDIAEVQAQNLLVRVNSYGGSVTDGIAIHNAIKRHSASVTVSVDGIAASIASLIAMAGDTVEMSENAMLMIHAPWGVVGGNSAALRDYADMLDSWAAAMSTSYAAKSGQSAADMLALLTDGKDHWYTAAEALAAGFCDSLVSASPESATAMASFDLTRYRTAPANLAQRTRAAAAAPTPALTAELLENPMTQTVTQLAAPANPAAATAEAIASAQASALAQDKTRRDAIRAAFKPHAALPGVTTLQMQCEDDHRISAEAAGLKLLAHMGSGASPIAGGVIHTVEDEGDKRREAMVNAMLLRANVADEKVRASASANPYRGRTLLALAESGLQAAGVRTDGMDKRQLVAAAFTQSSSDFPVLLENVMHKTLLSAYALQALTWQRFCKRGTVSDFRAHNRYRVGSLGNLLPKNELGEYKNVAIPDGEKSSITAATKGYIINISREAVINDDLGALTDQAAAMGRSSARTVESDVYALLTSNGGLGPVLNDGATLFHADHGNIGTGAAISTASLEAMRVLMAKQKDVSGNDYLDLRPAVLLCPIEIGGLARVLVGAEYDPDTSGKLQRPNVVRNIVGDIVDSQRLSGQRYYLLASSDAAPAIEVAFLDGNDTPYLELESAFDTDGGRYKVRLDYGVAGHDFRGAVTNAGA